MSSKQTRRSVSISGELYQALVARGATNGQGLSTQVEATMRAALGLPSKSAVAARPARARKSSKVEAPEKVVETSPAPAEPPKSKFITNTLRLTRPPRNPPERYGLPRRPEKEPASPPIRDAKSIFTF